MGAQGLLLTQILQLNCIIEVKNMSNVYFPGKSVLNGATLDFFTQDDLLAIHNATIDVLSDTGVLVVDEEARTIFKDAGCEVDDNKQIVKIPEHIINTILRLTPSRFNLYGRNKKNNLVQEAGGKVHFTNFGIGTKMSYLDESSGKYLTRDSLEQDCADTAKICDWAENIDYFTVAVAPMDLTGNAAEDVHAAFAAYQNTTKSSFLDLIADNFDYHVDLIKAYYGGDEEEARKKPIAFMGCCPTSPLEIGYDACQITIKSARIGIPNCIISMAMSGASSPIFNAGTLVVHNAEVLSTIALAQLTSPGSPVFYGSSTTGFDIKRATAPVGSPELALINAGVAKLAQFYGIPSFVAGT